MFCNPEVIMIMYRCVMPILTGLVTGYWQAENAGHVTWMTHSMMQHN